MHAWTRCRRREGNRLTRKGILRRAEKIVTGARDSQYGTPEDSFSRIAALWNEYLSMAPEGPLSALDVANMMVLLKIARLSNGPHLDSFVDVAGYAACAGEIATRKEGRTA